MLEVVDSYHRTAFAFEQMINDHALKDAKIEGWGDGLQLTTGQTTRVSLKLLLGMFNQTRYIPLKMLTGMTLEMVAAPGEEWLKTGGNTSQTFEF